MAERILNKDRLLCHGNTEAKKIALDILEAGLKASDPYYNVKQLIRRDGKNLRVGNPMFEPYGDPKAGHEEVINLEQIDRIYLFAWGKGIQRAAKAVEDILGDALDGGHVVGKYGDDVIMEKCGVTLASHPVPDKNCVEASQLIVSLCERLHFTENDLVITIVGNGVSSLMTYPVDNLTLDDVEEITQILQIEQGITTFDLNHIRNHVDKLKGGRINRYFGRAKMFHIAVCNPNLLYGSGMYARGYGYYTCMNTNRWLHTWPDNSTFGDALAIVKKWNAEERLNSRVIDYLKTAPQEHETMKPDEFERLNARIFGIAPFELQPTTVCKKRASELGLTAHILCKRFDCDAASSGFLVGNIASLCSREGEPFKTPCVILSTGELLVSVGNSKGIGGRNQEFVLSAALAIDGDKNIAIAAADTDGTDGPGGFFNDNATASGVTCLAGGVVDGFTFERARSMSVDLFKAIAEHATSNALWEIDCGIHAEQNMAIGDIHVTVVLDKERLLESVNEPLRNNIAGYLKG
jgi:glycerate-2-kinase